MPPRTPAPTYSLKSRDRCWITKPISAIARWSCTPAPVASTRRKGTHHRPAFERLGRAREEEPSRPRRVRRIGDDGVERAHQLRRQRPTEVVLDARGRERRIRELSLQKGDQPRIDVHDREVRDRRGRAVATYKERKRERGQVVVTEQEHAAADECTGLVDRKQAPDLRVHRAVALIQLESCGRAAANGFRELAHERRELVRDDDTPPAAARARGGRRASSCRLRRARARRASAAPAAAPRRRNACGAHHRRRRRSGPAARPPG